MSISVELRTTIHAVAHPSCCFDFFFFVVRQMIRFDHFVSHLFSTRMLPNSTSEQLSEFDSVDSIEDTVLCTLLLVALINFSCSGDIGCFSVTGSLFTVFVVKLPLFTSSMAFRNCTKLNYKSESLPQGDVATETAYLFQCNNAD